MTTMASTATQQRRRHPGGRNRIHPIRETVFRHRGWTFRSRKTHILHCNSQDPSDDGGHFGWKRELGCYQGQSLPDAIFHRNSLEIVHEPTGNRIRFCALEALRGWMSLDCDPVRDGRSNNYWRLKSKTVTNFDYDYTYTTLYRGGSDRIIGGEGGGDDGEQRRKGAGTATRTMHPQCYNYDSDGDGDGDTAMDHARADSSSFSARWRALSPVDGAVAEKNLFANNNDMGARLRKPICKCKGGGGRAPLVSPIPAPPLDGGRQNNDGVGRGPRRRKYTVASSSPPWRITTTEQVDIQETILSSPGGPIFRDEVELYEDDLHESGESFLKARLFVTRDRGWAALLRCFVRVDGVMARVIDTRYVCDGDDHVLREFSWREGLWEDLVGGASAAAGRAGLASRVNDSVAARVLPLKQPAVTESLLLVRGGAGQTQGRLPSMMPSLSDKLALVTAQIEGCEEGSGAAATASGAAAKTPSPPQLPLPPGGGEVSSSQQRRQSCCLLVNDFSIQSVCPVPLGTDVAKETGISFIVVCDGGKLVQGMRCRGAGDGHTIAPAWTRDKFDGVGGGSQQSSMGSGGAGSDEESPSILSVQMSGNAFDGGRLVLGDDYGWVHVWRLSTGEPLHGFPVAAPETQRVGGRMAQSSRLWVEQLAWNDDGSLIGAAAGRSAVLVSAGDGASLSRLESSSGTVTGIAFRHRSRSLAVASYGEIQWLHTDIKDQGGNPGTSERERLLAKLKRSGGAVECIAVSPDGNKVAAGFLDKTLRVFNVGENDTMNSKARGCRDGRGGKENPPVFVSLRSPATTDWVGFNAAVKSAQFSRQGNWLAAMGGCSILVVRDGMNSQFEAPIVCRTPGVMGEDGSDGTCSRFSSMVWSSEECRESTLFTVDASRKGGMVHVFDMNVTNQAWPRRALPILTISPTFPRPSSYVPTMCKVFPLTTVNNIETSSAEQQNNAMKFFVLGRKQQKDDEGGRSGDTTFSFRRILP